MERYKVWIASQPVWIWLDCPLCTKTLCWSLLREIYWANMAPAITTWSKNFCPVVQFCLIMSNILRRLSNKNNAQCAFWVIRWPCSQNGSVVQSVPDTIKRRGGYRGIFREEGVDTGPYFRENHGSRVWNSRFPHESCFPSNRTSRDKYMLNNLSRRNF